jgi:hypothetical protein
MKATIVFIDGDPDVIAAAVRSITANGPPLAPHAPEHEHDGADVIRLADRR